MLGFESTMLSVAFQGTGTVLSSTNGTGSCRSLDEQRRYLEPCSKNLVKSVMVEHGYGLRTRAAHPARSWVKQQRHYGHGGRAS